MNIIKDTIGCEISKIMNIQPLKKGMTNRSFSFEVNSKRYIMRVPGEGTEKLINRKHEYDVYQAIKDENICDPVIYMNPENGYKMSSCPPFMRRKILQMQNDFAFLFSLCLFPSAKAREICFRKAEICCK